YCRAGPVRDRPRTGRPRQRRGEAGARQAQRGGRCPARHEHAQRTRAPRQHGPARRGGRKSEMSVVQLAGGEPAGIAELMAEMGRRARAAASVLAMASSDAKRAALHAGADALDRRRAEVLAANARDLEAGRTTLSKAALDRLLLDD